MAERPSPSDVLVHMLKHTRDEELDCEQFVALLAALFDQGLDDEGLRQRMAEHERLCHECAEEAKILAAVLGIDRTASRSGESSE